MQLECQGCDPCTFRFDDSLLMMALPTDRDPSINKVLCIPKVTSYVTEHFFLREMPGVFSSPNPPPSFHHQLRV